MRAIYVPLTREEVMKDLERFLQCVDNGDIVRIMTDDSHDAHIDKCIGYASRMTKKLCCDYYAKGMGNSDVEGYFAQEAHVQPEQFCKAIETSRKSPMYRFVSIHVGRMMGHGIFRHRPKELAHALASQIDTMSEESIYKRINQGYNEVKK